MQSGQTRTVARKSLITGLYVCAGGLHSKNSKTPLVNSVSYFNFGGVGALFGDLSPPKLNAWKKLPLSSAKGVI